MYRCDHGHRDGDGCRVCDPSAFVPASDYDALVALARDLLEEVRDYTDGRNDELLDRADKLLGTPDAGVNHE